MRNPLLKMAWLNIWRNPRRTAILLCAMSAGLVGILFSMGFIRGWTRQMLSDAVSMYEGHVKILARGYNQNPVIENSFDVTDTMESALSGDRRISNWVARVSVQGLLSTPDHSMVVSLIGTGPEREVEVSTALRFMTDGHVLRPDSEGEVLLGRQLAEKLGGGVGRKVVLVSQQLGGEIGSAAFRATGIYDSRSGSFNERHVYVTMEEARKMLGLDRQVTEVTVMLHDIKDSQAVAEALNLQFNDPRIEVLSWRERLPYVRETLDMMDQYTWPYYVIFYLAMAFGIVNTLMMSIGERTREIGVLLAVGMPRLRLVRLILLESLFIAVVSVAIGLALGGTLVGWYAARGINLASFSEGMDLYGVSSVIYPFLPAADVMWAAAGTFAMALMFSLVPAWRAARLVPVDALRQGG